MFVENALGIKATGKTRQEARSNWTAAADAALRDGTGPAQLWAFAKPFGHRRESAQLVAALSGRTTPAQAAATVRQALSRQGIGTSRTHDAPDPHVFLGPIEGVPAIGETFNSRYGRTCLSGLPCPGSPVIFHGETIAQIGNNAHLENHHGQLYVALQRTPETAPAIEAAQRHALQVEADWRGAPDRWELDGGARVGVIDEWAIGPISLG